MAILVLVVVLLVQVSWSPVEATTYVIYANYAGTNCEGTPYSVNAYAEVDTTCTESEEDDCNSGGSGSTESVGRTRTVCTSNYTSAIRDLFGESPYVLQAGFDDADCSELSFAYGVLATGNCEGSYSETVGFGSIIANLYKNGSASIAYYDDNQCKSASMLGSEFADASTLLDHSCDGNWYKWYSSRSTGSSSGSLTSSTSGSTMLENSSSSSGVSTGAIIGVACGCIVVVLAVVVAIVCCRRRKNAKSDGQYTSTLDPNSPAAALSGQTGLWKDDVITAKRLPRDKIKTKKLLSRGAYGEVYNGVFNGQKVAVKMLLPATRGNLEHVTDLLTEAKLTASMDHPHIVSFIGVAWDSLSDLCVVLEFMDGGDLRTLLNKYEASKHPVGVDREKATIALHVCHALTYLHSLTPPVIHRDLKSRNILLNQAMEAKLTDFGISRERLDQTMTAGVGTSLWMAPEVMLGENYGVEADMFSFGVVLSELDVHTLPYAQAKQRSLDSSGRKMADARLLQKITTGEMRVDFSDSSPKALVELGNACVAVAPDDRPTAAEALYRLQVILSQELAE